ncbi:MAG TPA: hypothetical protein VLA90_06780 [Actinomycetota bacterium]|nr:hypothetical protein [Actinomycetota bacterium]
MSETVLGVVTAGWAVVMALAPVLQIRRISYWAVIGNPVLVVPNSLALLTGLAAIGVALRYR